jgi:hypothetical protein
MGNNQGVKRTFIAPNNPRPASGEMLSIEALAGSDVRWIWCHHGERGSSVIGYVVVSRESIQVLESRPIGFFPLEEKR